MKKKRKITFLILLLIIITLSGCKDSETSKSNRILDENYIPKNLEEALSQIDFYVSDSLKLEIKKKSESDFISETHFGLGIGMRNNWNLWKGSDLSKYFNSIEIFHPDDMSAIILTSYYRKLNGKDINLEEQIIGYKEYWKQVDLVQLPEKTEHPEPNLEFRVSIFYGFHTSKDRPAQVFIQTNSTNNTFWIYDYFYGWKKIDLKTKEILEKEQIQNTESILNKIFGNKTALPNNG
ncbi:conserved exported hypothetical protein [Tenacibaculum litoreum]|uniref:DUF6794 domain-containing protein n=1 Tax=Tenacibaculum TaxID=104267 RepID=UPI0038942112